MRFIRNFIITLLLLVLAAISVIGIMIEMPSILGWKPTAVNEMGSRLMALVRPHPEKERLWLWLAVAGGCLLVLLMSVFRRRKPMRIEVQMGGGRVVILDSAIKRYIRTALAELTDVTVRKINLRETRAGISTEIYADVKTQENLPVLERRMIQRVRAALAEDLGITSISDVHVFIRDFEVSGRPPGGRHDYDSAAEERVSAAKGPFDQVPVPDLMRKKAALTETTSPEPVAEPATDPLPNREERFFTPKPVPTSLSATLEQEGAAHVRPLPVREEANETFAPEPTAPVAVVEALPGELDASPAVPKKRRGFFGFGKSEGPAGEDLGATSESGEAAPEDASYNPVTTTETVGTLDSPVADGNVTAPNEASTHPSPASEPKSDN